MESFIFKKINLKLMNFVPVSNRTQNDRLIQLRRGCGMKFLLLVSRLVELSMLANAGTQNSLTSLCETTTQSRKCRLIGVGCRGLVIISKFVSLTIMIGSTQFRPFRIRIRRTFENPAGPAHIQIFEQTETNLK